MLYLLQRYHYSKKRTSLSFSLSLSLFTLLCAKTKTTHKVPLICQVISRYHFFWRLVPKKLFRVESRKCEKANSFSSTCVSTTLVLHFSFGGLFPFSYQEKRVLSASSFMGIFFSTFILLQHCLSYQHFYSVHWGFERKRSWNLGDI